MIVLYFQIRAIIWSGGDRLKGLGADCHDMSTEQGETTRTTVKTYVPAYQRETWDAHAEDLDMTRSEFVRSMVQAGRRGFGADPGSEDEGPPTSRPPSVEDDGDDGGDSSENRRPFETRILNALSTAEYLSWDELVDAVTSDIEDQLETTLQELQADNRVRYSGPNGGYTIDE